MLRTFIDRAGGAGRRIEPIRRILDWRLGRLQTRYERRYASRDRERISRLKQQRDLKLNIGSSTSHVEGWLSLDLRRDALGEILRLDATSPWPFTTASAVAINSEHFIEHVTLEGARSFLAEAFRVLAPGAVIRTSTPDLEGLMEIYRERDPETLEAHRAEGYDAADHGELVNNYFYMWEHRHIYDEAGLSRLLAEAGFTGMRRAAFGESVYPLLRGIDTHPMGRLAQLTLTVDAQKPQ